MKGAVPKCKVVETMEHILFQCKAKARKTIWKKAQKLWPQAHNQRSCPNINLGTVLGIGCITVTNNDQPNEQERSLTDAAAGQSSGKMSFASEG
jgi:hypothetical protein